MITIAATFLAKLDRFAGRIAEREAALLDYLAEPRTLDELVAHRFLYPPHAQLSFIDAAERRTIDAAPRLVSLASGTRRAMRRADSLASVSARL